MDLLPSAVFLSVILSYSHYTVLKAVEITSTLSFTRFPAVIPSALRRVSSKVNWLAKLDTPLQDSLGTSTVKDLRALLLKLFRKQAISLCQKKRLELEEAIRFYIRGSLLKSEAEDEANTFTDLSNITDLYSNSAMSSDASGASFRMILGLGKYTSLIECHVPRQERLLELDLDRDDRGINTLSWLYSYYFR